MPARTRRQGERPAPGRRERQKAARERRILAAAKAPFAERGYAGTTMGAIARRARRRGDALQLLPSKPEIVAVLLRRETGAALDAGERVRKEPPAEPEGAILALFDVYVDLVLRHDRRLLRELIAAANAEPDPLAKATFELDAASPRRARRERGGRRRAGVERRTRRPRRHCAPVHILPAWCVARRNSNGALDVREPPVMTNPQRARG